jgi:tol-pal system protein YbgF
MRGRLLAVALLVPLAGGCAMKSDIRELQADVAQMQAAQQRLLLEIQRQNAVLMDSLSSQNVRLRGDFTNQLVQIERQLVQVQELTGQGQQQLAQMRETLRAREEALRQVEAELNSPAAAGDPLELFATAEGALQRGSLATARAGFEEFTLAFPQHEHAPAARLYLGAMLANEGQHQQALEQYSRILELHPNSPEAPSALFRAAIIERERGNADRARSMLNQLTAAYPRSPEAVDAREELRRMR